MAQHSENEQLKKRLVLARALALIGASCAGAALAQQPDCALDQSSRVPHRVPDARAVGAHGQIASACCCPHSHRLTVAAAGPTILRVADTGLRGMFESREPEQEFLLPDAAFALSMEPAGPQELLARLVIADGYYLYRRSLSFTLAPTGNITLRRYALPPGKPKTDEYFGQTAVYYRQLDVRLVLAEISLASQNVDLEVRYQGCAERGICYPPITKRFTVALRGGSISTVTPLEAALPPATRGTGKQQ